MEKRIRLIPVFVCVLAAISLATDIPAQRNPSDDRGESKEQMALKNRATRPKQADIDKDVTLEGLLAKKDMSGFSTSKGATVEGYVIQVEKEDDGDFHIAMAPTAGETDTQKWVIVEVTPAWRKRNASMSDAKVKQLHGKKVRVTGWLYYEMDDDQKDPRGTKWEIHPVTDITVIK